MTGSTYTVNTVPQQLYPGWQKTVTIQNNGPSSVWVSNDSSVNVITSFRLRPNAVMVWSPNQALWAMCETMEEFSTVITGGVNNHITGARLTVVDDSVYLNENNPTARQIYSEAGVSTTYATTFGHVRLFETSSYESLHLEYALPVNATWPTTAGIRVYHFSDDKNLLTTEEYVLTITAIQASRTYVAVVPAYGAYTVVKFFTLGIPAVPYTFLAVKYLGYIKARPIEITQRVYTAPLNVTSGTQIVNRQDGGGTNFQVSMNDRNCLGINNFNGTVWLPSLGQTLSIFVQTGTSGGAFVVQDPRANDGLFATGVLGASLNFQFTFQVPISAACRLVWFGGATDNTIVFHWSNPTEG